MPIRYLGLEKLGENKFDIAISMSDRYYEKLDRESTIYEMTIDFKTESPTGKRKQFRILGKIVLGHGGVLTAEVKDWDFRRALHKLFNKLLNELEHKFKTKGRKH